MWPNNQPEGGPPPDVVSRNVLEFEELQKKMQKKHVKNDPWLQPPIKKVETPHRRIQSASQDWGE